MLNKRQAFRRKKVNMVNFYVVSAFLLLLLVTTTVSGFRLRQKSAELEAKRQQLEVAIAEQDEYTQELEVLKKYTKTKKYAEEVAKQKLGLVYADEIVFKPESSQ